MSKSTHRTAVVWVPPEAVWPPIQAIRADYDRQVERWMPHVNLLYPFAPPADLPEVLPGLERACAGVPPFVGRLGEPRYFAHRQGRYTLWLAPEPAQAFRALQAALQAAHPAFDHQARFPGGFTPHLSLGQARGEAELEARRRDIEARWTPADVEVTEIRVIRRAPDGPFVEAARVPLGGTESPEANRSE